MSDGDLFPLPSLLPFLLLLSWLLWKQAGRFEVPVTYCSPEVVKLCPHDSLTGTCESMERERESTHAADVTHTCTRGHAHSLQCLERNLRSI